MITWLVGENDFEIREALNEIIAQFEGVPERFDATTLTLAQLPDILMGMSLLAFQRLVLITDISQNATLWEKLPDWLPRVSDDIHVVFVDAKPDKRRVAYKVLKETAEYREFPAWSDRDTTKAEVWLGRRAQQQGVVLDTKSRQALIAQVGVNQWQLAQALDTLSLVEANPITPEVIRSVIPINPTENVLQLLETALKGQPQQVTAKIATLALHEDPYALFALLSSQILSLAAITFAGDDDRPSRDFGLHPYVVTTYKKYAHQLGRAKVTFIVRSCAHTDVDMKHSRAEPWLLVEQLLLKIAAVP